MSPVEPRDVVLHIGSGKTGTSTIQRVLRRNADLLLAGGHVYPRTPGQVRHTKLGLYVRPDDELVGRVDWLEGDFPEPAEFRRRFRRQLRRELAGSTAEGVVFSDEGLFGASDRAIRRTRRFLEGIARSVRLVVYLRRQDDHLVSRYQQVVKMGEIAPLATWIQQEWDGTYDYYDRLTSWQRIEPAAFVVRPFERARFAGGSLVHDFLQAADIELAEDELTHTEARNESLGVEGTELLRILNLHRVQHEGAWPGRFGNAAHVARLREVPTGKVLTLPDADLDTFMAGWAESNRKVAQEFLHDPAGELFRAPRKTAGTTTEQVLDPARLDHYLELLEIPEEQHATLRAIAEREATRPRS